MNMKKNLDKVLDECLDRIGKGEAAEDCLTDYPEMQEELEPLLTAATAISSLPEFTPSDEFRKAARGRLMAKLQQDAEVRPVREERSLSMFNRLITRIHGLWQMMVGAKRIAIPLTLGLVIVLGTTIGASSIISPSATLASGCTLTILSGTVEVQSPEIENSQGVTGMTLDVGDRIITSPDSHALLTFFDGSTLKLDPGTDIEIEELESNDDQSVTIIVKQWMGRTWSRVVKMADSGSRYEIETPSACAIVRGTLFTTEVDEDGETTVATTQGLVSVVGQEEEVFLPPNQQTQVEVGATPSEPSESPSPVSEITITIDGAAVGSVIDPTGASTGCFDNGESFNQIIGSQSIITEDGQQIITIPQPTDGEYMIALRYIDEGTTHFNIQGTSDGQVVMDYSNDYEGSEEDGWLVRVNLAIDDGIIVGNDILGVEPLPDETPEKVHKPAKDANENKPEKHANQTGNGNPAANSAGTGNQGNGQSQGKPGEDNENDPGNGNGWDNGQSHNQNDDNSQGNSSEQNVNIADYKEAKADAKALIEEAKANAKALEEEAKANAKALEEEAKANAKALKEAAEAESEISEEFSEADAKALIEAAKAEAKALIEAAKAEAKALKEAAKAEAKALKEAAEAEAKALKEAAKAEAEALKEATQTQDPINDEEALCGDESGEQDGDDGEDQDTSVNG